MALRVVGLGPGHPKLLTLMAVEALREAEAIYVPASSSSEVSLAESLVRPYTRAEVRVLKFKMGGTDEETLKRYGKEISGAENAVYALLGDPALYGSFARLRPYVERPVQYVPGVTSITACAARAGIDLAVGDQAVAIVPATRPDLLERAIELFDTVVVVKANKNMALLNRLMERGGLAVRRCYMEGEQISQRIYWDDYFTVVYIWRGR